jgi:hypothetical protein
VSQSELSGAQGSAAYAKATARRGDIGSMIVGGEKGMGHRAESIEAGVRSQKTEGGKEHRAWGILRQAQDK